MFDTMPFLEAGFVGLYASILGICLQYVTDTRVQLLLASGFAKHFLGYWLGLHTFYCKVCRGDRNTVASNIHWLQLIAESVGEAILFLCVGWFLFLFINDPLWVLFGVGFLLHSTFEVIGVHRDFCKGRCENPTTKNRSTKQSVAKTT